MRVVYGDGASPSLIEAAGVRQPRAIVVTYANDKRCLEATRRLHEYFPDAPVFVRAPTALEAEPLLQAGATEVMVEAVESAVRLASLLDTCVDAAGTLLRAPLASADAAAERALPYPEGELDDLAAECGISRAQVGRLYDGFAMLEPNGEGEVELRAMRDTLARVGVGPSADDELDAWWVAQAGRDGSNTLSFFEYVRVVQVDAQRSEKLAGVATREGAGGGAAS